jgi:hypothetical protein
MSLKLVGKYLPVFSAAGFLLVSGSTAFADGLGLLGGKCPPPFVHCQEGPPCVKFKHLCPKPVCDPCNLQHYGYFATCWHPWPFPADFTHCPYPPHAPLPGPIVGPAMKSEPAPVSEKGPMPSPDSAPKLDEKKSKDALPESAPSPQEKKSKDVLPELPKQ